LVGLGVGLEVRRTNGENKVLLENLNMHQKKYNNIIIT
jgi:hypothetical protein